MALFFIYPFFSLISPFPVFSKKEEPKRKNYEKDKGKVHAIRRGQKQEMQVTQIPRKMCHVFSVNTTLATHILQKMCHIYGVNTTLVTHILRKMCHAFGVSTALLTHILRKMFFC